LASLASYFWEIDAWQPGLAFVQYTLGLGTLVYFLVWLGRAYGNLSALGAQPPKLSRGSAVEYFFVPLHLFVRPYEAVKELWNRSAPRLADGGRAPEESRIVAAWWILFLMACFLDRAIFMQLFRGSSISPSWLAPLSDCLSYLSSTAAILVVTGIDERQQKRVAQMTSTSTSPPLQIREVP